MNGYLKRIGLAIWKLLTPAPEPVVPVAVHAKDDVPQFTPPEWKAMFYDRAVIRGYCVRPGWKGYCLHKVEST